ncbi:hypothetical protein LRAMOSA09946 [Lichtheimia ramosa]|uniref:Uncharacterized protein n=1 Tax=Lichtheimia ramosa TaxID=688394 RepID=A0A077WMJ3_9FUNG|nr:hypothetical protein LRAMOSA09946 [Lichtheimia ramosa]
MAMNRLDGKVAVITGGARGLGKAVALALVDRGAKVMIGDLLDEQGAQTVDELNARVGGSKVAAYLHTNVVSYKDNVALFQQAEKEFGGVDIVHLNAGIIGGSKIAFTPLDDEQDEKVIAVNTIGVMKGTKVALLHLAKRGGGVIVCTSSVAGFHIDPELLAYNASKHALIGWIRSFTMLPAVCNVRINAVCPHVMLTDMVTSEPVSDASLAIQKTLPPTSVDTAVKAVLQLIDDLSANRKALMALPGGVIREEPSLKLPAEATSPALRKELAKTIPTRIQHYKEELADAMNRYFKSHL